MAAVRSVHGVVFVARDDAQEGNALIERTLTPRVALVSPDGKLAMGYAGHCPDFRRLLKSAQAAVERHRVLYGERMTVKRLAAEVGRRVQEATLGGVRPFCVSLLVGGVDDDGVPALFLVDAAGEVQGWRGAVIGEGSREAMTKMAGEWSESSSCEDALLLARSVIGVEGGGNGAERVIRCP